MRQAGPLPPSGRTLSMRGRPLIRPAGHLLPRGEKGRIRTGHSYRTPVRYSPPGGANAPAARPVPGFERSRDLLHRPAPLPHQLQRAGDRADLVVQEGSRPRLDDDLLADPPDIEAVERAHRATSPDQAAARKRREVVPSDERLRGRTHRVGIERARDPPYPPCVEGRAGAAVEDAIAIGARRRVEPRVEVVRDPLGGEDGDGVRAQVCVERAHQPLRRPVRRHVAVRHLGRRVDARIGSPCALHARRPGAAGLGRRLQRALHRQPLGLTLPADEGRAVIFDGQLVAGHGRHRVDDGQT